MRKTFIGLLAAGALFMSAPAQAHDPFSPAGGGTYIFQGAAPCAVGCSYWVNQGFTPCENPFPPGAYQDKVTNGAPPPAADKTVTILDAHMDATIDWDSFFCESGGLHAELAQGANILGEPCDNIAGENSLAPVGCHEQLSTPRKLGQTTIFRAYNWSDVGPAPASWHYLSI